MSIDILEAGSSDAALLARLHRKSFDDAWDESAFDRILENPCAFALLALREDGEKRPAAFVAIQTAADEAEILTLATEPEARRMGLAKRLVRRAMIEAARRGARTMYLEVAADNDAALALYRDAGFAMVGRRESYYRRADGSAADALLLTIALTR